MISVAAYAAGTVAAVPSATVSATGQAVCGGIVVPVLLLVGKSV